MKCKDCRHGKRFAAGAVNCIRYGMIIREDHECERGGFEQREDNNGDGRGEGADETEVQRDNRGAPGEMPDVLPGSGERAGLHGMERKTEEGSIKE